MTGAVFALATGVLIADPVVRQGSRGNFTTATIRSGAGDDCQFIGLIAFQEAGELVARFHKGDAISVNGRATVRTWDKNGETRAGLSIVVGEVIAPKPAARAAAPRRRRAQPRPQPSQPVGDGKPFNDELPW